jgi:glycosyltransferase involved in cell wall biosynthesis
MQLPRLLIVGWLPPPFIGPAVATKRLIVSPVLGQYFEIDFLDISDPEGFTDIGKLSFGNITQALKHCLKCVKLLYRHRPHVAYLPISRGFWGFLRDLALIIPLKLAGVAVVAHLRAGRFDLLYDNGPLGRVIARCGLAMTSYGIVLGESLRTVFGDLIPQSRIRVVPNGLDLNAWKRPTEVSTPMKKDRFEILYLSNLYRDKGAHVFLMALPAVRQQIPNVHVTFAGEWYDLPYKNECMELVDSTQSKDCVDFVGRVGDQAKKELLNRADLVVFVPVKPEGLPWVILEAMAASKPVIASAQGVIGEVILDQVTGLIIRDDNPVTLASYITRLASDPTLSATMGVNGRRRIEEVYSEEVTHGLLAKVMLEAISIHAKA